MIEQPHIKKSFKSIEQGAASVVLAAVGKEYEGIGGVRLPVRAVPRKSLKTDPATLRSRRCLPWIRLLML